jgi:hypothetical protein
MIFSRFIFRELNEIDDYRIKHISNHLENLSKEFNKEILKTNIRSSKSEFVILLDDLETKTSKEFM